DENQNVKTTDSHKTASTSIKVVKVTSHFADCIKIQIGYLRVP
ncbi:40898_t:CDS:1, partial [Gigaspora margarita]